MGGQQFVPLSNNSTQLLNNQHTTLMQCGYSSYKTEWNEGGTELLSAEQCGCVTTNTVEDITDGGCVV